MRQNVLKLSMEFKKYIFITVFSSSLKIYATNLKKKQMQTILKKRNKKNHFINYKSCFGINFLFKTF